MVGPMSNYKYLHKFSPIRCDLCSTREYLTQNEYTDMILCDSCLDGERNLDEIMQDDIEELRGDERLQITKEK